MKVIAITKVQTSKGEIVERMQTMLLALQPGDQMLSDPTVYVRPKDFDANSLLTQGSEPLPKVTGTPSYLRQS